MAALDDPVNYRIDANQGCNDHVGDVMTSDQAATLQIGDVLISIKTKDYYQIYNIVSDVIYLVKMSYSRKVFPYTRKQIETQFEKK